MLHSCPMTALPGDFLVIPLNAYSNNHLKCPKA